MAPSTNVHISKVVYLLLCGENVMTIETAWHKNLVNYHQSSEERRLKYFLCRWLGDNREWAQRRRDWRWNKIARVHGYINFLELSEYLNIEVKEVIYSIVSKRKLVAK